MTATTEVRSPVGELIAFIRQEAYAAGDRLPPLRQLSQTLGFGRNATRDALLEAQTMGYVRIEPRSRVFVQDAAAGRGSDSLGQALERLLGQNEQNLFHLLDARLLVESDVAAAAARNRRRGTAAPAATGAGCSTGQRGAVLHSAGSAADDRAGQVELAALG